MSNPHVLTASIPSKASFDSQRLANVQALLQEETGKVFPCAVLLVAWRGQCILHNAYGYLRPETSSWPTQTDTLFDLASITKLFTATTFMTLVEEGAVKLDIPVVEVLPTFQGLRTIAPYEDPLQPGAYIQIETRNTPIPAESVTFRHLLLHNSGLPAWRPLFHSPSAAAAQSLAIKTFFSYTPGKFIVYSDIGLILVGIAIQRLTGKSLDQAIQSRTIAPLGLTRTVFNPLLHSFTPEMIAPTELCVWRKNRCRGEVHDENAARLGGVAGHAGLFSTAWELAVFGQMFLNGGSYRGTQILQPETVLEMIRIHANNDVNPRGLGWQLHASTGSSAGQRFGPRSFGHTGFSGTSLWADPDRELVVVLLTNRVYYGRDPQGIQDFRPRLHDAILDALEDE